MYRYIEYIQFKIKFFFLDFEKRYLENYVEQKNWIIIENDWFRPYYLQSNPSKKQHMCRR